MSPLRICAVLLLAAGIFALVHGGVSVVQAHHEVAVRPSGSPQGIWTGAGIAVWPGVAAIVAGGALFLAPVSGRLRLPARRAPARDGLDASRR